MFMGHGTMDGVVPIGRARMSRDVLQELGYQIEWHEYPMPHSTCGEEVQHIGLWLRKILAS